MTLPIYCPQYIQTEYGTQYDQYNEYNKKRNNKVIKVDNNNNNSDNNNNNDNNDNMLPSYQSRQNKMLSILYEYETLPTYLVTGFIRDINNNNKYEYIIPQDLINICFKFYQHCDIVKLIDSKTCDELYTISWEATENKEYLFAEQIINYLLLNKEQDASITNLMAVIQYFMKNYKLSEKYFKLASLIDKKCDIIMNNYAVLLLEEGRYLDAEKQICAAITCNPQCIKNHQQYAYILYSMGKYEEAAKECQLMILLEPNIESYSGYAWLLEQMGQYNQSKKQYSQLIKLQPNNPNHYYWYAILLQKCKNYKLSMINFEKCLILSNNIYKKPHEGANGNYAYSLYLNHKYKLSYKYIQIALNLNNDKKHLCVHYYYSLICIQLNKIQTAVNELYLCLDIINTQNHNINMCKNEKGCLNIQHHHIYNLLNKLGY